MDINEALEIVLELAQQNALDYQDHTPGDTLYQEALRQDNALRMIEDFVRDHYPFEKDN